MVVFVKKDFFDKLLPLNYYQIMTETEGSPTPPPTEKNEKITILSPLPEQRKNEFSKRTAELTNQTGSWTNGVTETVTKNWETINNRVVQPAASFEEKGTRGLEQQADQGKKEATKKAESIKENWHNTYKSLVLNNMEKLVVQEKLPQPEAIEIGNRILNIISQMRTEQTSTFSITDSALRKIKQAIYQIIKKTNNPEINRIVGGRDMAQEISVEKRRKESDEKIYRLHKEYFGLINEIVSARQPLDKN